MNVWRPAFFGILIFASSAAQVRWRRKRVFLRMTILAKSNARIHASACSGIVKVRGRMPFDTPFGKPTRMNFSSRLILTADSPRRMRSISLCRIPQKKESIA